MEALGEQGALKGGLAGVSLGELLVFLAEGQRSGRLELVFREGLGLALALQGGRIAKVGGPLAPRLSDTLLALGTPSERVAAIGEALTGGEGVWEIARRFPELLEAQKQRALLALLPFLLYPKGRFAFHPTPKAPPQGVDAREIVLEGLRRLDELGEAPDPLGIWSIPERLGEVGERLRALLPLDWRILGVVDGERTLAQGAALAVLPWDGFARGVLRLEALGLLEARPLALPKGRLRPGDPAPNFTLRSLDGSLFSLGERRGKKTLLAFFRHAGCPFCNFRLHELIRAYPALRAAGVEPVGIFGSPLETLRTRAGRQSPPFPLLADPEDTVHERYGTGQSLLGLLDPRGLPTYLKGLRLGIPHGSTDGELLRMPAEFLLDGELRVVRAHYGAHGGDRLPLPEVLAWAGENPG